MKQTLVLPMACVGIVLVCVGSSIAFGASDPSQHSLVVEHSSFVLGPYTQQSMKHSCLVSWQTTTPATRNEVHWGLTEDVGMISGEQGFLAHTFHTVLVSGLAASTQYFYKVVSDGQQSALYTFSTAAETQDEVHFVVYGDNRGGWDEWRNATLVAQAIEAQRPLFVISTGDLVDDGRYQENWVDFFSASSFVHNSTLYPVLGNHERYGLWYFVYFSLPHNERWYSFDNGPAHIVCLDSNLRHAFGVLQLAWLVSDLQTHSQPFTIVCFHHPFYSSGNHGNATLLRLIWAPILQHFGVDVVFNGHDHDYERSVVDGITYIVTGGGGAPLYDVGQGPWTVYSEKTFHYCAVTVNATALTCEAIKPDGTVFDSFSISH